jgi:flagellar M-ring protein FliF
MDQAKKLLGALTARQLATIVIVAIAVVAGVMGFSRWERESGLRTLYTGLAPEDASAIVQKLHEAGVEYKITNNGTELLAPEDKVPELRPKRDASDSRSSTKPILASPTSPNT